MSSKPIKPRAVFFGTPDFSVPSLVALLDVAEVVLVVSQPDRRSGRGLKYLPTPVKRTAEQRGVAVVQPKKIRTRKFAEMLRSLDADVGVVVAYGRILPSSVLDAPRLGCLNVHASLLPKYRGAAPIQWSIVNGEKETGVCLMQMDEGMDTGPMLAVERTDIGPDETALSLSQRLSTMGAEILRRNIIKYIKGELTAIAQDHRCATSAPLLRKEDGLVNWEKSAGEIHNLARGMNPWPGAYSWLDKRRIKLHRTHVLCDGEQKYLPGTIVRVDANGMDVACGKGILVIDELQVEGKRRMKIAEFLAGNSLPEPSVFSSSNEL